MEEKLYHDSLGRFIKGHSRPNKMKGKKLPETWCKAMLGRNVWNKGTKGLIKANSGTFKKGISVSPATQFKKGDKPPWAGKTRPNISQENHPNWQGGKSFEPYPLGWTRTYREQIRYRDGYKCQICSMPEVESNRRLTVHHIDCDKENINIDNLVTLCTSCHTKLHWKLNKGGDADASEKFCNRIQRKTDGSV